jgi:galactokinase/mevalonate kinase-like predicted kinase
MAEPPRPSSPRGHDRKHPSFPFDCIVVTSPDAASAASAEAPLTRILERRLKQEYPDQTIRIISTYDSYGARCGSGGGTLAALEFAAPGETVLVLHAGGDSSRCPTQMILGKAWTSLPSAQYPNPTIWMIDQIQRLFEQAHFPRGTVVVAATDTLITFFEKETSRKHTASQSWNLDPYLNEAVVLGVAVPSVVTTAKNHGVYVLSEKISRTQCLEVTDPLDVWQKPSFRQLIETQDPGPATFVQGVDTGNDEQRLAWIDTGVIIFLPKAVQILYDLSNGILAMCTRKGIKAAYDKRGAAEQHQTLAQYAKDHALKIDLYTEIMHNLSWPSQVSNTEETPLRQVLSRVPLNVLVAPQGRFLHLGTTQELVDFVTAGAYPQDSGDGSSSIPQDTIAALSAHFSLKPRFQCWTDAQPLAHNVALQSTFPSNTIIGDSSLVEYCEFDAYSSISIGSESMVSGWRNPTNDDSPLSIPGGVSVQVLALEQRDVTRKEFVYMVVGICDGIKTKRSETTLFGIPMSNFLERTGMTPRDLGWTDDIEGESHNLWNAMLHPKVSQGTSFSSIYGWLDKLLGNESLEDEPSLMKWLSTPRVTLRELHDLADAEMEWSFRQTLERRVSMLQQTNAIPHLQSLLRERRYDRPLDLQWILELPDLVTATDLLEDVLLALEDLALLELGRNQYDISGRAFMVASALLADFDDKLEGQESGMDASEAILAFCSPVILQLRSSSTRNVSSEMKVDKLTKVLQYRRSHTRESLIQNLAAFSLVMEKLSFCMNELCIASGYMKFVDPSSDANVCSQRTSRPVLSKWVISTSPARVDLAGGWSDTPPLCYEFGGSVTGMAVLVDGYKPLSCRCRILPGKTGILLRTDNRSGKDGELGSFVEVEVQDMAQLCNFRDPLSDCTLLKAALVCLGLVEEAQIRSNDSLQPLINEFCSSEGNDFRIEIVTASMLPQGSGMGTSSILAATVLASVAKCIGIGELEVDFLLHAVLMLEQLLTSGGGWQDQANGIIPGIKTIKSLPSQLPASISVQHVEVETSFKAELETRLVLAFTGKTRLAKNILQDVLRRWARSTNEIVATVSRNVELAEECRTAILTGDVGKFGSILQEYSKIKVQMAGEDSGAMPETCRLLISELLERKVITGACLCGAGGGGFMAMIISESFSKEKLSDLIRTELAVENHELSTFTFHDCQICQDGLTTKIMEEVDGSLEDFSLSW